MQKYFCCALIVQELVEEAKTYHLLTDRRGELRSPRTRPRKASGRLCVFMLDIFSIFLYTHVRQHIFSL